MTKGIKFSEIKIDNDLICDGHHRYLSSLIAKMPIETIPSNKTSATKVIDWNSVSFDENDWDTAAKIRFLNEQDAEYNNIPLSEFVELLTKL